METGDVLTLSSSRKDTGYKSALEGPFSTPQLTRISDALEAANRETGLEFSVYVGPLRWPADDILDVYESDMDALPSTTHAARALHAKLPRSGEAVLLALSPNERAVEVVTGEKAGKLLDDKTCGLVILSAVSSFRVGDLTGGIVTALRMLTDRASE